MDSEIDQSMYVRVIRHSACPDVHTLMTIHDIKLPGNSYHDHEMDNINMLRNDLDIELDVIVITEAKRPNKLSRFDKLTPVLRTMMPSSRRPSQVESLIALNKRNMAVPELDGLVDQQALGERLLTQYVDACVNPSKKNIC